MFRILNETNFQGKRRQRRNCRVSVGAGASALRAYPVAPEGEIEVTAEMIEAGYQVFVRSGVMDDPLEADRLTVEEIYRAMRLVSLGEPRRNAKRLTSDHAQT